MHLLTFKRFVFCAKERLHTTLQTKCFTCVWQNLTENLSVGLFHIFLDFMETFVKIYKAFIKYWTKWIFERDILSDFSIIAKKFQALKLNIEVNF